MSTRACVIIKKGRSNIYLYRHYDGYPMEWFPTDPVDSSQGFYDGCGIDLAKRLGLAVDRVLMAEPTEPTDPLNYLMEDLLTRPYDGHDHHYRVTDDLHGDLDFIYYLDFSQSSDDHRYEKKMSKLRFSIHENYWCEKRNNIFRRIHMDKTFNNWSHPSDDRHSQIEFLIKHELLIARADAKIEQTISEEVA